MEINQAQSKTSKLNRLNLILARAYEVIRSTPLSLSLSLFHSPETSLDGVLERHQKMQEEVAEDMVKLARSLKNNATIAKEIIKKDKDVRKMGHFHLIDLLYTAVSGLLIKIFTNISQLFQYLVPMHGCLFDSVAVIILLP